MQRISELKILQGVPFEKDTNTSMTFDSLTEQTQYFSNFAIKSFNDLSFVKGFLYKKVRVQCDIEDVYNANYLMWKNNDGKWFYAYITGFEFVSELATEINFDMDYIQSYMGDIVFNECDIEREHTEDDEVYEKFGENNVDPLIKKEDYVIDKIYTDYITSWKVAVYYKPNLLLQSLESVGSGWTKTDSGGTLTTKDKILVKPKSEYISEGGTSFSVSDKVYSGCEVEYFNISNNSDRQQLQEKLTELEITGYHVVDVIMIPKSVVGVKAESSIEIEASPYYSSGQICGYTPMNKLLYCYPFMKLEVSNMQGNQRDYRYEYFLKKNHEQSKINILTFRKLSNYIGGTVENLIPIGYNDYRSQTVMANDRTSYDYGISTQVSPKCIWNENSFVVNLAKGAISTAITAGTMLATGIPMGLTGFDFKPKDSLVNDLTQMALDGEENKKGSQSTNALSQLLFDTFGFLYKRMCYNLTKLQEYDIMFSLYGYYYERTLKRPNLLGRSRFNYIKTRKALISGDIPIEAKRDVIDKLQNGYTFWHDKTNTHYGNIRETSYKNTIITKELTERGTIF